MQLPTVSEKYHVNHDENTLRKLVYGPTYVLYNEDGQKLLLPQTTDMSRKDNLKLLYNSLPEGMCKNEYESLEQAVNDVETFQYSHEVSTKHVLVQGVYVGSASPLIANIKTQPYSMCDRLKALKGVLFRSTLLTHPQTRVCGFLSPEMLQTRVST